MLRASSGTRHPFDCFVVVPRPYGPRSLRLIHQIVERAIRQAQARDKVRRNVASLVDIPEGQEGRPSGP